MTDITNDQYSFFSKLIYEKTGNLFTETDYYRLDGRLNDLKKKYELDNVEELVNFYKKNPSLADIDALINSATNNETLFLRDKKPFAALKKGIIPELMKAQPGAVIKIWSAAASTGQEAYSIIMTLMENFPALSFNIEGTDISDAAITKAENGIYSQLEVQRGLPATYLIKYFDQLEDKTWQVKREIRAKVTFKKFNLLQDEIGSNKFDIVFCRNVMIYFDIESRKLLVGKIERAMKDKAKLILGSGESIIGIKTSLNQKFYDDLLSFEKDTSNKG